MFEGSHAGEKYHFHVLMPDDDSYHIRRVLWNGAFDARPAEIVVCRSTEGVVRALRYIRQRQKVLAVRAGGHSPAGFSTIMGG